MKAEIYRACDVPAWRKQIIYSADKRDEKTSEAARQDVDESCREEAYQRSTRLNGAVLDAVLSGSDKAALRGLADNRVLPVPARLDIHRRARVRLRELGEPTQAFEDFDLFERERLPENAATNTETQRAPGVPGEIIEELRVTLQEIRSAVAAGRPYRLLDAV